MSEAPTAFVLVNGRLTDARRARVSIFDRGFQYGESLIETLRIDCGRPVALDQHRARIAGSARALGFPCPPFDWSAAIARLVQANELAHGEAWVRMTLTRGEGPRRLLPPEVEDPHWVIASGRVDAAIVEARHEGIAVVTLGFGRGEALAEHKHSFYFPSIIGKQHAAAAGAFDGLFVDRGFVQCATTANLFARIDDAWITPQGPGILPGVTRERAINALAAMGSAVVARRLRRHELSGATEVFLTNSLFEVLPVVRIDGEPVGRGAPGSTTTAVQTALVGSESAGHARAARDRTVPRRLTAHRPRARVR